LEGIVGYTALLPQRQEDVSRRPLVDTAMGGTTGTEARLMQGMPLAARAEDEEDGIHRLALLDAGPMTPQGVRLARREQRHDVLPQLIGNTPITVGLLVVFMHL
jgi:hypothetical protein